MWNWRIDLFEREYVMFNSFTDLINMYPLKFGVEDRWRWRWATNDVYSTKVVYERLIKVNSAEEEVEKEHFSLLWNKIIPLKIQVHAWRVMWERI